MLTNHKKEQFMTRSGSYSTHASRRGYSDLGLPMEYSDLLPPAERRKILLEKFAFLNSIYPSSRKIREDKTKISAMLSVIKQEIKEYNISSAAMHESRMSFGRYFLEYCKKNMPVDYYKTLVEAARKEFDEIGS